jgi:broad specificity phosphatase PhoE
MEILFIRHGESTSNFALSNNTNYDPNNITLTELGKTQAQKTGKVLKNYGKIDVVFYSPIKRCIETANIIAKEVGNKNLQENKLLVESGEEYHKFSGLSKKERDEIMSKQKEYIKLHENYKKEKNIFTRTKIQKKIINKELKITKSKPDVYGLENNCNKFLKFLSKQNYKRVVVVSHRGTIQMFLKILCNIDAYNMNIKILPKDNNDNIYINNCSITGVKYENNKFTLVFSSNIEHL